MNGLPAWFTNPKAKRREQFGDQKIGKKKAVPKPSTKKERKFGKIPKGARLSKKERHQLGEAYSAKIALDKQFQDSMKRDQ
jgi:hypothetical protein